LFWDEFDNSQRNIFSYLKIKGGYYRTAGDPPPVLILSNDHSFSFTDFNKQIPTKFEFVKIINSTEKFFDKDGKIPGEKIKECAVFIWELLEFLIENKNKINELIILSKCKERRRSIEGAVSKLSRKLLIPLKIKKSQLYYDLKNASDIIQPEKLY
jgi:hypothetical protein